MLLAGMGAGVDVLTGVVGTIVALFFCQRFQFDELFVEVPALRANYLQADGFSDLYAVSDLVVCGCNFCNSLRWRSLWAVVDMFRRWKLLANPLRR
jgi:hypothetical protein